jgi:predicted dehydrogenase/nucleoside-diphosphate-sugar epimerase
MHRVCLVGAGNVSETHARALACVPTAEGVAACDPDLDRAHALSRKYGLSAAFGSLYEAIASGTFDSAHVLVPPSLHASVAEELLAAGVDVFLEKPMAVSTEACLALTAQAQRHDARLGVNHNATFYPAYLELRRRLLERTYGPLQHLIVAWNVGRAALPRPDHFMLQRPQNLAFETAVHPFSQVYDLAGPLLSIESVFSGQNEVAPGQPFYDTWMMSMICERATAQVCVSYAGSYRLWQLVAICEDGILTVEVERNRITALDRTRWGRYYEPLHPAIHLGVQEAGRAVANMYREVAATLRRTHRTPYFMSMLDSVAAFHREPVAGEPVVDGDFGRGVVAMCEAASERIAADVPASLRRRRARRRLSKCDVLITGGTGFIGKSVVEQMLSAGATVRVMARSIGGLPDLFCDNALQLVQGDVSDADAVSAAVRGARTVAHLATGDLSSFETAETSIVGATDHIARACLVEDVQRLVFTGTIASLYLGDQCEVITGATPTDPDIQALGPYAGGKARSEALLRGYFDEHALPICILRPGVVLGGGGTPFHSGFGIWRGEVHCVGWNQGRNPLPLVLSIDAASAIVAALSHQAATGNSYNLVGDVRLCARECIEELSLALERPLVFHGMHPAQHHSLQVCKWLARSALRRKLAPPPSYRAIKSMGYAARFDCSDAKADFGWTPLADRAAFIDQALRVHAARSHQRREVRATASARHG